MTETNKMTEPSKIGFGEQLIQMQPINVSAAEQYRSEVQAMLEKKLSRAQRWHFGVVGVFYILASLLLAYLWPSRLSQRPFLVQFNGLFWCAVGSLLPIGLFALWVAVRGYYKKKTWRQVALLIATISMGAMGWVLLDLGWANEDPFVQRGLILAGTIMLLLLGITFVMAHLEEMHRRTEERLMRMEYRLAELGEKLDRLTARPSQ